MYSKYQPLIYLQMVANDITSFRLRCTLYNFTLSWYFIHPCFDIDMYAKYQPLIYLPTVANAIINFTLRCRLYRGAWSQTKDVKTQRRSDLTSKCKGDNTIGVRKKIRTRLDIHQLLLSARMELHSKQKKQT